MTQTRDITRQVLNYYDRTAEDYVRKTFSLDTSELRARFTRYLPSGAYLLDAGCGSGRDALLFRAQGYQVDAFDGSPETARLATKLTGIPVQCRTFAQMQEREVYDAIWACATLVHLDDLGFCEALRNLQRALKPGAHLYFCVKAGTGLRTAGDGRVFNDFTLPRLLDVPAMAHFKLVESWHSESVANTTDVWLNVILRKPLA